MRWRRIGPDADGPEAVLAALDPEQRQVALATRGPVCVLAGAGHRQDPGDRAPDRLRGADRRGEPASRARRHLHHPGGGRAAAAGCASSPGPPVAGWSRYRPGRSTRRRCASSPTSGRAPWGAGRRPVLDSKLGLLTEIARELRVHGRPAGAARRRGRDRVGQGHPGAAGRLSRGRGRRRPDPAAGRGDHWPACTPGTRELRRERHLVDFESVLELTAAILAEHRTAAAEVADRYRYFVVDEFQDVNPLQKLLLDAWTGGRDDVCVVGDPRQTIYSFTGATPAYLTGFTAEFPHATVVRLVRNYRSTPQVVALANRLTGAAGGRRRRPPRDEPLPGGARAWSGSGPPARSRNSPATRTRRPRRRRSPRRAAELIASGVPAREMAVLVRINVQTERFEQALARGGGALPGAGDGTVLRAGRGAPGDGDAAGAAAASGHRRGRRPAGRGQARAVRARPDQEAATGPGLGPGAVGVPGGAGPAGRRLLRGHARRGAGRHRRPSSPTGPRSSMPRPRTG